MNKKFTVLVLMLVSLVIFLPSPSEAAAGRDTANPVNSAPEYNLFAQNGRGRRRGWYNNRRWNRYRYGRTVRNRRATLVRQTYWRNGRRYVRYVRVYR